MDTYEALVTRRSIREFQDKEVSYNLLERYVNAGRLAPQAANRQPLEFIIIDDKDLLGDFFENTKLAGYLSWEPSSDKKAKAYIAIVANTEIQKDKWIPYDVALAAENISLAAWADGVGSCMIGAFNKVKVTKALNIPGQYDLALLVALGFPAHKSQYEDMKDDSVDYWRDDDGNFHVPKRPLNKILHHNKFQK